MFCPFPKHSSLPLQNLQARVNREVMHFMQYLQDVANQCADDYNFITEAALQYSEVINYWNTSVASSLRCTFVCFKLRYVLLLFFRSSSKTVWSTLARSLSVIRFTR